MKLKTGLMDNIERKFIPVRNDSLDSYLASLTKVEEYEITQVFKNGYKYRSLKDKKDVKYTRNKKMNSVTEVVEIEENSFLEVIQSTNNYIKKIRKCYIDGSYKVFVDYFSFPIDMIIVEVETNGEDLSKYVPPKHFLEVTGNKLFDNINICNGSIISNHAIIEGTDGVGKTETIKGLLKQGIICTDRCTEVISKNMVDGVSLEKRTQIYFDYLKHIDKIIVILVNNDENELKRRLNKRGSLSDFDKETGKYNRMYLDTYQYMLDNDLLEEKMFLINCTGLTVEEQVEQVRNIIIKTQKVRGMI